MDSSYRNNHYVPQLYQRGFLPDNGEKKFYYLDLQPDFLKKIDNKPVYKNDLRRLGTKSCFSQYDLYTTKFKNLINTDIEKIFFGGIDNSSKSSIDFVSSFEHPNWVSQHFTNLINFMSLQKLRTPKGLQQFNSFLGGSANSQQILIAMQSLKNLFSATWTDCIWQIASAEFSDVKFIMSDHPVTVYNKKFVPGVKGVRNEEDPDIRLNGTHTIFPLNKNKILIITNLSWVRNPCGNPLLSKPNPVLMRDSLFDMSSIQTGRFLSEKEVMEFNYIIKKRALRYIASENKDWLYPEKRLIQKGWFTLGGGDLCMPDPRSVVFTSESVIGYKTGQVDSFDEYGYRPWDKSFNNDERSIREFNLFEKAKKDFARKHGKTRRGRAFSFGKLDPIEDPDM